MKVYRVDLPCGEYYTLNEKELKAEFTEQELQEFRNDDEVIFYETKFTVRQLNRARKLHSNEDYHLEFEDEYGIDPEVLDILKLLYN